jgi:hypothetical protein
MSKQTPTRLHNGPDPQQAGPQWTVSSRSAAYGLIGGPAGAAPPPELSPGCRSGNPADGDPPEGGSPLSIEPYSSPGQLLDPGSGDRFASRGQLIPVSAAEHWPIDRAEQHENGADHQQNDAYGRQDADARQPSDD